MKSFPVEELHPFKKIFSKRKKEKKKALCQVEGCKKARAERSGVHFTLSFLSAWNLYLLPFYFFGLNLNCFLFNRMLKRRRI